MWLLFNFRKNFLAKPNKNLTFILTPLFPLRRRHLLNLNLGGGKKKQKNKIENDNERCE